MLRKTLKKVCPKLIFEAYRSLYSYARRKYHAIKYRPLIAATHEHYKEVEERIRNRGDKPLRFASYVVYDSTFGAYGLMDLMLANPQKYSPKIIICPDVARGEHQLKEQYKKTKDFFVRKYGSEYVIDGYDEATGAFKDVSDQFDVIYCANPYDAMVDKVHGVQYLSKKNVLPVYMSYGCMPDHYGCEIIMPMLEISLFWKVFADNKFSFADYKKYELYKGKNVCLSGYAKMDDLAKFDRRTDSAKKRIIIAPHHTINNQALPLSNFLKYSDFILELPKKYPEIEFIFRPHPLLFVNMVNEGFWTKKQVDEYIEQVQKNGIIYSVGGDYFDVFINSDAMIHDCSSFVVEYLYTGKPCCFVAKTNYKKIFSELGKSCLENYYIAFDKQQIMNFIENVIINDNDSLKEKRTVYAKNYLAINYPNASKEVLNQITL